jgi:hypothetical protein
MKVSVLLISLLFSGCAGLGLNKQATLMPDTVGLYYETGPNNTQNEWQTIKIGTRADWKFAAPPLKEKTNVSK